MKLIALLIFSLASSISMASGYLCSGDGYHIKLYNEVMPAEGTKNPAVLVVSSQEGTLAVLRGDEIAQDLNAESVVYSGTAHDYQTGRFVSVSLLVYRNDEAEGLRYGELKLNADGATANADVTCKTYLKGDVN